MKKKKMTLRSRLLSFRYAFEGLYHLVRNEPNVWIHSLATIVVIVLGVINGLPAMRWAALCIAIGLVWATEAINTAIEKLCDMYTGGIYDERVKVIKDVAAGAVLVAAMTSVVIAVFVFLIP